MTFGVFIAAALCGYTNCAGRVIVSDPTAVTNGWVSFGARRMSLAVFPPSEQRRLRAAVGQQPLAPRQVRELELIRSRERRVNALERDGIISAEAAREARRRNRSVRAAISATAP